MAMLTVLISLYLLAGINQGSSSTTYANQLPHKRHPRATSDSNSFSNEVLTWTCPLKYSNGHYSIWYRFFNSLFCKLSEYEIQVAKRNFNVDDIEKWGHAADAWKGATGAKERLNSRELGININRYNFQTFLNKIATYNIADYDSIKKIAITEKELEELNHVLNLTIKQGIHISCKEQYMFIKGDYIILSQISQYILSGTTDDSCKGSSNVRFLNIFALNTIFIDADLPTFGIFEPLTVIAPKWLIIGKRQIDYSGKTGDLLTSRPSLFHFHGRDGRPGNPGGPGGNFFGIGQEFFGGTNLTLSFNGGKGGPGEDGENGRNGNDGRAPNLPDKYNSCPSDSCADDKQINLFQCERMSCTRSKQAPYASTAILLFCEYKLFGTDGTAGGNGGNGGKGGKGGSPGNIDLFELNNYSGISQEVFYGQDGSDGNGGAGGIGGKKGHDKIVQCEPRAFREAAWSLVRDIHSNKRAPSGKKGLKGVNSKELETPRAAYAISNLHKAKIINHYKSYLRENLSDRFKHYFLNKFLNKLENNNKVKALYETLGFIDELLSLEEHFHKLNENLNLLPFYQSLLTRINEYAQNPTDTLNPSLRKKVLGYLYAASLGKIINLEDELESSLIIDVSSYLETVKNDIQKLKDLRNGKNKEEIINKYKQKYKREIDTKIKEAMDFISKEITPEINNIAIETDKQIERLVNEIVNLTKERRIEHKLLTQKKHELEKKLIFQSMVSILKMIASIITCMGDGGQVAGTVMNSVGTAAEIFISNTPGSGAPLTQSVEDLESLKGKIQHVRDQKVASLKKSLDSISEETGKHPETFADLSVKLSNLRNRLDEISRSAVDSYQFQELQNLEIEVKTTLKAKERESAHAEERTADQKTKNEYMAIQNMLKAVQLNSVTLDIYNKHKLNQAKLDEMNNLIAQNKLKFYELKRFEDKMYTTVLPMFQSMLNDIDNMIRKLDQKSKVALDVAKWKVKSTLGDMMMQMQQLAKTFSAQPQITRCIEKMIEAILTVINVHDHVRDFQRNQHFANFIADLNSIIVSHNPIFEEDFRYALTKLEIALTSSIVLQRHKVAIDAFKQFVFPFAHTYFKGLILPIHLKLADNKINVEDLVNNAVAEIEHIKSQLELYKQTVRKHDGCIGSGEFKSNYFSNKPFFVWKNQEYKSMISKLLSGETVTVRADVTVSANHMDAIKFNVIDFRFKSKDQTKQLEIDSALKRFRITATHLGNSYYRYNNTVYRMITPSQNIWYFYEKDNYGEPVHKSRSYQKIKTGDFMLSPYACWRIKLHNLTDYFSFSNLEAYKDDVDLELGGYGHYIDKRNTDCSDLKVDRYYKSVDTFYKTISSFQLNTSSPVLRDDVFPSSQPIVNQENSDIGSNSFSVNLFGQDYVNSNLGLSNEESDPFSTRNQDDQDYQENSDFEPNSFSLNLFGQDYVNSNLGLTNEESDPFSTMNLENQDYHENSDFEPNSFSLDLFGQDFVNSDLGLSNEGFDTFSKIDHEDQNNKESTEYENQYTKSSGWLDGWF